MELALSISAAQEYTFLKSI